MNSSNLENLIKTKKIKLEAPNADEFGGLVSSGKTRLHDAENNQLAAESRFDLAYNAAHSLALAALRWHGYRPSNRYIVFQAIPSTLNLGPDVWRVLAKCHEQRNLAEYEGYIELDERLLADLLLATKQVLLKIETLK